MSEIPYVQSLNSILRYIKYFIIMEKSSYLIFQGNKNVTLFFKCYMLLNICSLMIYLLGKKGM